MSYQDIDLLKKDILYLEVKSLVIGKAVWVKQTKEKVFCTQEAEIIPFDTLKSVGGDKC